jgi:hypothetical protein
MGITITNVLLNREGDIEITADIDLCQKCIHLRHNLFAPILHVLLHHLFVQTMGFICANKIAIHLRHCNKFIVLL